MAVPVLRSGYSLTVTSGVASSITLTAPTTIVAGDSLYLFCMDDADNQATSLFQTPTGYTSVGSAADGSNDTCIHVFKKDNATGSEGNVTVDHSGVSDELMGWYVAISGTDTTNSIHLVGTPAFGVAASLAIPAITTTVVDCLAFYVHSFDGGDGLPFSVSGTGWTEQAEGQEQTDGNTVSGSFGTKPMATTGDTLDATVSASVSDGITGFQFAVKPASAGVTVGLTGVSATGAVGSVGVGVSLLLATVLATGNIGTLSPSSATPISGVQANSAVGNISFTESGSVGLTGNQAAGNVGTVVASNSGSAELSGVQGSGLVGDTPTSIVIALTGVQGSGSVGSVSNQLSKAISGNAATGSVGDVTVPSAASASSLLVLPEEYHPDFISPLIKAVFNVVIDWNHPLVKNATSLLRFNRRTALPYDDVLKENWTADTTNGTTPYQYQPVDGNMAFARQDIDEAGICYKSSTIGVDTHTKPFFHLVIYTVLAAPTTSFRAVFQFGNLIRDGGPTTLLTSESSSSLRYFTSNGYQFTNIPTQVGKKHILCHRFDGNNTHDFYDSAKGVWETHSGGMANDRVDDRVWIGTGWNGELPCAFELVVTGVDCDITLAECKGIVKDPYAFLKPKQPLILPISRVVGVQQSLTGVESIGSVGSVSQSREVPLTGVQGLGEIGDLVPQISKALSGEQAIGEVGTVSFTKSGSVLLTGIQAVSNIGSVGFTESGAVGLTGVEGVGQVGSVGIAVSGSVELTGVQGSGQIGSLSPQLSKALISIQGAGLVGDVGNSISIAIDGIEGIGSVGSVTASAGATVGLSGIEGTGEIGSVSFTKSGSVLISGVEGTGYTGTVGYTKSGSVELLGVEGIGQTGTVTASAGATVGLSGVQGSGQIGNVGFTKSGSVAITGIESIGAIGGVGFTESGNVGLLGVVATGQVGTVTPSIVTLTRPSTYYYMNLLAGAK